MENKLMVEVGNGNHKPTGKQNMAPINLNLCADARKAECNYYIKVMINTPFLSFHQGFCGWNYRKGE